MTDARELSKGFLHQADAQRWIDEVRPFALSLVVGVAGYDPRTATAQTGAEAPNVFARQVDSIDAAPHRGLMLTWPERTGHDAVINHLLDCRAFLALYARFLEDLRDAVRFRAVLSDGSRLRLAVTNDVLQVLAPGPSGEYSMIRHHALMFLAAHLWLPSTDQKLWRDLYRSSIPLAADRYRASGERGDVREYLEDLERSAFAALDRLSAVVLPGNPVVPDGTDVALVLSYMHAANAAVAVLIDAYDAVSRPKRFDWLVEQLAVYYRDDDYLADSWAAMANAASSRP